MMPENWRTFFPKTYDAMIRETMRAMLPLKIDLGHGVDKVVPMTVKVGPRTPTTIDFGKGPMPILNYTFTKGDCTMETKTGLVVKEANVGRERAVSALLLEGRIVRASGLKPKRIHEGRVEFRSTWGARGWRAGTADHDTDLKQLKDFVQTHRTYDIMEEVEAHEELTVEEAKLLVAHGGEVVSRLREACTCGTYHEHRIYYTFGGVTDHYLLTGVEGRFLYKKAPEGTHDSLF